MRNEKYISVFFVMILVSSFVSALEYYITPDGETVYYSPPPRVFIYKPLAPSEKIYDVFVPHGKEPEKVLDPRDVYVDHKDRVYVTDAGALAIKAYSALGILLRKIDVRSREPGETASPGAVAVSPLGEIFMTDLNRGNVRVFDFTGRFHGVFSPSNEKEKIDFPEDLAVSRDSSLYILDSRKSGVHRYSFRKEWIGFWGGLGDKTGEMNHPGGMALGRNGEAYIADARNHRIAIYSPNGAFIRSFGKKGETPGRFSFPRAIAVDPGGLIAVEDLNGSRIQFFSSLGEFLVETRFDKEETPQEVKASSLSFDSIGALYIVDDLGKRILKISPMQIHKALN